MTSLTVKNLKAVSLGVVGATVVGVGLGSAPAEAATIFTDEASFLTQVQSGSYLENFNSRTSGTVPSPQSFSGGVFSYNASSSPTAPNGLFSNNLFFRNLNSNPSSDRAISPLDARDSLTFTFTSGNVSAIGGNFYTAFAGTPTTGPYTFTLSDGTTLTLNSTDSSTFRGFIADPGTVFTSLVVTGSFASAPYVDNLRVGTAIPTPALVPGLVGLAVAAWRKRKGEATGFAVNSDDLN